MISRDLSISRLIIYIATIVIILSSYGCSNSNELTGKWQLTSYEYSDGTSENVGDIFYNFQSGSFSAICALENYDYVTFFGNYSLSDGKISIILLPDYSGDVYNEFIGWEDCERTFSIEALTSDCLRLKYDGCVAIFRRY
jgi:hypothetical protein